MNLIEGLLLEIERCQEMRRHAIEVGEPGKFLVTMRSLSIERAKMAMTNGDVVAMAQAAKDLRGYSE